MDYKLTGEVTEQQKAALIFSPVFLYQKEKIKTEQICNMKNTIYCLWITAFHLQLQDPDSPYAFNF